MITIDVRPSKQCNGKYSMFVSFPYNDKIVSVIREQPTRYWNKDKKEWELPTKRFKTLINELTGYDFTLTGDITKLAEEKITLPDDISFNFKTNPFDHQIEGFKFGCSHDAWLLADEQGLGKTKQVIDIAVSKKLNNGFKHCLIVCGVNGLKWNWQNEIRTHSNETGHILGQRIKGCKTVIGSNNDKLNDLINLDKIDSYFLITNVESLRNEGICTKLAEYCKKGIINMVAIDEIHKCKNPSSQQGKGILKLKPEYRVAMTGTPIMNNPLDLYIILKWLGYEKHAFYSFKNHYCIMGGFGGYEVIGYRHMDELEEQLHEFMLRRLKSDVLDLPEKLYIDEFVDMTAKQAQIYEEISAEIQANIDKIETSNNPLAELIRMRQATGYTGILSSTVKESAKLDRLEELVEETIANANKCVIFSNWTQITQIICDRLKRKYECITITGEVGDNERSIAVSEFQNNPNVKVAIGTIGAMGTGLTLTAANTVIFVDEPWTMANKQQAIDRCHRIGTTSNVTVYTLMCKNTIDERIHEIVEKKGAISDALVDGKITGNKTELLNFLLS